MFQGDTSTDASTTNVLLMMRKFRDSPEDVESDEMSEGMYSLSPSCSQESVVESVVSSEPQPVLPSASERAPVQTLGRNEDLNSSKPSTCTKQVMDSSYSPQHREHECNRHV